jgi:hypothetical protein
MEPNAHKVAHRIILSVVGLTLQSPNLDLTMLATARVVFILLLGFRFSSGN